MEKRRLLFLFLAVSIIFLLSFSIVSAVWYSPFLDFWNKITGKVISGENIEIPSAVREVKVGNKGRVDVKITLYFNKSLPFIVEEKIPEGYVLKSVSPKYNKPVYDNKNLADSAVSWVSWPDSKNIKWTSAQKNLG